MGRARNGRVRASREVVYVGAYWAVMCEANHGYNPMTLSEVNRLRRALDADVRQRRKELRCKAKKNGKL